MKLFKSFYKLIFLAIILLFPTQKSYAISQAVPIKVDWYYNEDKWDSSPHRTDLVVEPIGSAPLPKEAREFYGVGDIEFSFAPNFDNPGKYEYLIYQDNEDIEENHMWVRYDRTVYRLVFFVQVGKDGLDISSYAYDNDNYDAENVNTGKLAKIVFKNIDPAHHRKDGTIIKPSDPDHPQAKKDPQYPKDPNKSYPTSKKSVDKDKNSTNNVKTGIRGIWPYLGVLVLALIILIYLNNKNKNLK